MARLGGFFELGFLVIDRCRCEPGDLCLDRSSCALDLQVAAHPYQQQSGLSGWRPSTRKMTREYLTGVLLVYTPFSFTLTCVQFSVSIYKNKIVGFSSCLPRGSFGEAGISLPNSGDTLAIAGGLILVGAATDNLFHATDVHFFQRAQISGARRFSSGSGLALMPRSMLESMPGSAAVSVWPLTESFRVRYTWSMWRKGNTSRSLNTPVRMLEGRGLVTADV